MILPDFKLFRPANLENLFEIVSEQKDFSFLAGGTDLLPHMKRGHFNVRSLVSLKKIKGLSGVEDKGEIIIGPMTTLHELSLNEVIKTELPQLARVANLVASPQIRYQATLGGNLLANNRCKFFNQSAIDRNHHAPCFKASGEICHLIPNATKTAVPVCRARFISDLAPTLILMNAELIIASSHERRIVSLKDFYPIDGLPNVKINELIVGVRIPPQKPAFWGYEKLRIRNALDFPSMGLAIRVRGKKGERELALSLTGVDTYPISLVFEEQNFSSEKDFIDAASHEAVKKISPLKQDFFSPQYRKKMIPVYLSRWFKKPH